MSFTTLDFHVQATDSDNFTVTAFARDSAKSLASGNFAYQLNDLTQFEINRLEFNARDPQGRLERLAAFGSKLYQKIFGGALQQLLQEYREQNDFLVLCVRIHENAKGLEAVPWETLHDGNEFLGVGAKTTITRLPLGIVPPNDMPAIPLPIKMLAFVSSPPDLPDGARLNIEREQEILLEAVNAPAGQGKLHVDFEDEAKLEILESSLDAEYHILHFTGHGIAPENGGGLLLEDHDGKKLPVGVNEFLTSLTKGFSALRLAVISGCNTAQTLHTGAFSDLARALVEKKIPAVLAMQFSISDAGGLALAKSLYPEIIAGKTLERAVHKTRRDLWLTDDPFLQADALAMVLLAGYGNCLQTKAPDSKDAAPVINTQINIDTNFQLGTLPQLGFGFYGRRKEYRQMRDALNNHRAVIIHGIGGIGKTSLIAHAADRLYHRRKRFNGVYAFDCSGSALAPERILLELHRYFALQGINALENFLHQSFEPEMLAQIVSQILSQWPLLLIFDNFETQLARKEQNFQIANDDLRRFLAALVKATPTNTKFVFTCRFLFELDERLGDVSALPLGDLSRPEAFSVMLKLPRLAKASYPEKGKIYDTFGGHPFALVALDKYCQTVPIDSALQNAKAVHTKLREHLAIELNYGRLSEQARELLNRLAAFRIAVPIEAAEWVMGESVTPSPEALQQRMMDIRKNEKLPAELREADDETLSQVLLEIFARRRKTPDNLPQWVRELIEWGLLTPVVEDNELSRVEVHSLVRDFCRDQQPDIWRDRLRDAAKFYTNITEQIPKNEKTQAIVMMEMEAFELLIEAGDYRDAAVILSGAHELLDRWGLGRYAESQYNRVLDKVDRADYAALIHNFGMLQQDRGNYEAALDYYQRSLKIKEEIGNVAGAAASLHQIGIMQYLRGNYEAALDYYQRSLKIKEEIGNMASAATSLHQIGMMQQERENYEAALDYYQRSLKIAEEIGDVAGAATTLGQMGNLLMEVGRFAEAFGLMMQALSTFIQLESPNAGIVANMLRTLRGNWDGFDAAWRKTMGDDMPEWLAQE